MQAPSSLRHCHIFARPRPRRAQELEAPSLAAADMCSCNTCRGWLAPQRQVAASRPTAAAASVAQLPQELLCHILELALADDQEQQRRQAPLWCCTAHACAGYLRP